jgi:subtilase family serine protease
MKPALTPILATILLLAQNGWGDPLPDLVPIDIEVPPLIRAPPNPVVQVTWAVTNQGAGEAIGYWNDLLYFSTKNFFDSSAFFLAYQGAPSPVEPGDVYWSTNQVTLPIVQSGSYYLIVRANAYQYLPESNFDNNDLAAGFTFESTPADLAPLSLLVNSNITGPPNPIVTVAWAVTNLGPGYASGVWGDTLFISSNPTLDSTAVSLLSQGESGPVPAGGFYWRTNTPRVPVVQSGTYYLFLQTDQGNSLYETQTNNNVAVATVTFNIEPPDLAPLALLAPTVLTSAPNPTITLVYGVTNQGTGPAIGNYYWDDRVYLSTDTNIQWADLLLMNNYEIGPIAAGDTYWRTNTTVLPVVSSSNYYLIFQTDASGWLYESDTNNNTLVVPISLTIQRPDLVPLTQFPSDITGPPFPAVTLVSGATNQGIGPALGSWTDFILFATNADAALQGAGFGFSQAGPVLPGGVYWQTNTVRLPAVQDGTYYLALESDYYANLYESDRSNNVVTKPVNIHIRPPDLSPIALLLPNVITSPPNAQLTFVWGITNQGTGPAIGNNYWSDIVYLSTNSVWDNTAISLNSSYEYGPVAAGGSYWRTNILHLPIVQSGTYYFFLKVDSFDNLVESDEQNNLLALSVNFVVQPPDLTPIVSQIPTNVIGPPNPMLTLVWGVTNQGSGLAQGYWSGWYDGVFLSTNGILDNQAIDIAGWLGGGPLAAGASYWYSNIVSVPITQSGTYYLLFKADRTDSIFESDKSNNIAVVPVSFTILPPDLAPISLQIPSDVTGPPNPNVTVVWGVTNQGVGPAVMNNNGYWSDALYFSRNATLDASDPLIGSQSESGPVNAGQSYWRTNTFRVPAVTSTNGYLIFKTDTYNALFESNETNNTLAVPISVHILPPDLMPVAFQVPNAVTSPPQPTVTFVWGVTNQGTGVADPGYFWSWNDSVYLSTNSVFDKAAISCGSTFETTPIPAGGSYWRTNAFSLPIIQSGTYYLFFTTDASHTIYESDFGNNTVSVPVTFTIQPSDLAVIAFQAPPTITGPPKPQLTTVWGVTNQGIGAALGSWGDSFFISSKPVLDYTATEITVAEIGPLQPGDSYWRTNTWTLPITQSGNYYLFFQADSADSLNESDMSNNQASRPLSVVIQPPDLAPVALLVTNFVVGPPYPNVTFVWGVTNQGLGAAVPGAGYPYWAWQDQLSVCAGPGQGGGCSIVGSASETDIVPPGESYWRTNSFRVPVVASGAYLFRFDVDINGALYESSFTNNEITLPVTFQIQPPDLAPIVLKAPRNVAGPPNPEVKLSWGVTNQGVGVAVGNGSWYDRVYLSPNPFLDFSALTVAANWETGPVSPGGNYWRSQTVSMPVSQSGNYYLIFVADADHSLYDANYSNNTVVVPITFNITPPDLAPIVFLAPTTISGAQLTNVTLIWGVTNQGVGPATTGNGWGWCDSVVLSTAPGGTWSDIQVCTSCGQDDIPAGGSYWKTNIVRLPVFESGNYYFILQADAGRSILESNETNNTMVVPVNVNVELPDLAPLALQVADPISGPAYPNVTIIYAITNQGAGLALGQNGWQDAIWFSSTNMLDGSEIPVIWTYQPDPILPGDTYWRTNLVHLPTFQSGQYYLLLKTDTYNQLEESDKSNNVVVVPINVIIQPSDVAIIGLQVPTPFPDSRFPEVTLAWGVTNQGTGTAGNGWDWWQAVYLSTVPVFDSNALYVLSFQETNSLPPGASKWFTNDVILPLTASGQYYIFVSANANNSLYELNISNDVAVAPVTFSMQLPDLAPIGFHLPDSLTIPPYPWMTLSWGVTNQGLGDATVQGQGSWFIGVWWDDLWLSSSSIVDSNAVLVSAYVETNTLPAGESYWQTNTVRLPISQSGTYYLIFTANFWSNAVESNFSNNTVVVPFVANVQAPDLTPLVFQVPNVITGQPAPEVTVVWGVTNQGSGPALSPYISPDASPYYSQLADALYVSSSPNVDEISLSPAVVWPRTAPIPPGTGYIHTNTVRLPVINSGTYYLVFKTDAFQAVVESDELNNSVAIPVTFQLTPPADLTALSLIAPRSISGPGNLPVTLAWHVINQGFGPVTGRWRDFFYLYGPFNIPVYLGAASVDGPLLVGADYWQTNSVILPVSQTGDYEISVFVGGDLFDVDFQDNSLTVPITVTITGPPEVRLTDPQIGPTGTVQLSVYGAVGAYYTLQGSVDLTNWSRVVDFICARDPMTLYDLDARNYAWRFYRVAPLTNSAALRVDLGARQPWTSAGLLLKVDGPAGAACEIQASTDLTAWQPVANLTNTITPRLFLDTTASNYSRRFYRAVSY